MKLKFSWKEFTLKHNAAAKIRLGTCEEKRCFND